MTVKEIFTSKNIKMTRQREQILNVLFDSARPLSLDEIQDRCKEINFSSIFRAIKLFTEKDIVQEHYFGDKKPKYNLLTGENHNHFIKCVECGKIEELKNVCVLNEVESKTSFKIIDHYMEFMGTCPKCTK